MHVGTVRFSCGRRGYPFLCPLRGIRHVARSEYVSADSVRQIATPPSVHREHRERFIVVFVNISSYVAECPERSVQFSSFLSNIAQSASFC